MGKQTRCSQCSAQADLHTDPADGKVYCTICWEQYYGKGAVSLLLISTNGQCVPGFTHGLHTDKCIVRFAFHDDVV